MIEVYERKDESRGWEGLLEITIPRIACMYGIRFT
jgi:hypothetical protein